jgi:hypothetical protein
MALGKNMKVDRLIPLSDENKNNVEDGFDINLDLNESLDELSLEEEKSSIMDLTLDDEVINEVVEDVQNEEVVILNLDEISEPEPQSDPQAQAEPQPQSQPEAQSQPAIVYENVETDSLKIIFTPSRRKTQKRILINIEGALTINNVDVLYSKVNVVFDNYDFVEVTMTNVTDIDLTVIQLFHAIRVSYWSQKKYISINAEFSRDDRKLLNTCGFTEFQTQKTDA